LPLGRTVNRGRPAAKSLTDERSEMADERLEGPGQK
jgi:hypothetical protein